MPHPVGVTGEPRVPANDHGPIVDGRAAARPRLGRGASTLVWLVAIVDLVLVLATIGANAPGLESIAAIMLATALYLLLSLYGVVGALVATRRPHNAIGWLILAAATMLASALPGDMVVAGLRETMPALAALAAPLPGMLLGAAFYLILVFVPLLFPDGTLPSRRWRIVAGYTTVGLALQIVLRATRTDETSALTTAAGIISATSIALALMAVVVRFRSGDRIQRQQIKWFAAAASVAAFGFLGSLLPVDSPAWIIFMVGSALVPVAIGVAVLRYRLYEIDRIISRTISWALVTGLLVATFAGLVIGLTAALQSIAGGSSFAVAGSTLVVFALFQPLRRRVQTVVDRRFDRARYDAQRTAAAFAARLRDEVDIEAVMGDLGETVRASLNPTTLELWLRGAR